MKNNINKIFTLGIITLLLTILIPPIILATTTNNQNNTYDLLILTPSKFKKNLQPLVNHKNNIGVKTTMISLDDVYEEMYWYGRDKPEKIKYFIKTAMEKWGIKYVLLVGN